MINKYKIFDEPEKTFDQLFKRMNEAKKSIYIESYHFFNDIIGRKFLDLLLEKVEEGIKVTLIVDRFGWGNFSKERKKKLAQSKINFYIFKPYLKRFSFKTIKKFIKIHFVNHRKLTIIDSKYAFVGGFNYSAKEFNWRDLFIEITGPLVKELVMAAHEMESIVKKKYFRKRKIFKKLSKCFQEEDILVRQIPRSKHKLLKKQLIKLFKNAKKEILIVTPYLILDSSLKKILKNKSEKGIKVKIIIPNKSDSWFSNKMNHFSSYLLTKNGIQIYWYKGMIHSKYLIIDNEIVTFGSANMNYQTFHHNYELNVISSNKLLIKQLKKSFNRDLKESKLYEEQNWNKRSWISKLITPLLKKHKRHF